jgi:PAS domain S-box-containing protein
MSEPENPADLSSEGTSDPERLLQGIRRQVSGAGVVVVTLAITPLVILSIVRARGIGWHTAMYGYFGLAALVWASVHFRKRIPHRVQVSILVGVCFLLGVGGILISGLIGIGLMWLVMFSIITVSVLGTRAGFVGIAASLATILVIWSAIHSWASSLHLDGSAEPVPETSWLAAVACIVVFLAMAVSFVGRLQVSLGESLQTAQEQTAALQVSEHRFRTLVENAADAFFLHDTQGRIIDVNQRACDSLGYSRAELLSMDVSDVERNARSAERARRYWGALSPGDTATVEGVHRRRDGTTFPVEVHLRQLDWSDQKPVLALVRDITKRKRAEEAVRRSEEQLRTLVGSIPGVVYCCEAGESWRIAYVSEAVVSLTGRPVSHFLNESRQRITDLIFPEDAEEVAQVVMQALAKREAFEVEYRIRHSDGGLRWAREKGRGVYDQDERLRWLDGVILDVTERTCTHDGMRALAEDLPGKHGVEFLREMLRSLTEGLDMDYALVGELRPGERDLISVLAAYSDGEYVEMPDYDLKGTPCENVVGKKACCYPVDVASQFPDDVLLAEMGAVSYAGVPLFDSSGVAIGVLCVLDREPFSAPEVVLSMLKMFAISATAELERQRSEETLRQGEKKYRDLVETSHDLIWASDSEGCFTYVNPASEEVLGYPIEEMLGRRFIDFQPTAIVERDLPVYSEFLASGKIAGYETIYLTKSGEEKTLIFNARVITDATGRVVSCQGTAHDITERRRAEKEHRELEAKLRRAQKLEAVGTLAAGVAHEFNNSLTVILANAEIARDITGVEGVAQAAIDQIISASGQASEISRSLLTFSRETPEETAPIELGEFTRKSARMLQPILPAAVEISVAAPEGEKLWIEADHVRLNQVLMNLVINARDAMPEGGYLNIAAKSKAANASKARPEVAMQERGAVVLSVSDTGMGMSEEVLARVCDPFFSTKGRGQGTGLGMAVVHGIVQSHGGTMHIESHVGRGTRVVIEFPRREPAESSLHRPAARTAAPHIQATVLVADDNRQIRALIAAALDAAGCSVVQAADGAEALRTFNGRAGSIDLAIMDLDMPKLDGRTCLASMRKRRPDLPAIWISGSPYSVAHEAGAAEEIFLRKPFQMAELSRLADQLLRELALSKDRLNG